MSELYKLVLETVTKETVDLLYYALSQEGWLASQAGGDDHLSAWCCGGPGAVARPLSATSLCWHLPGPPGRVSELLAPFVSSGGFFCLCSFLS